MANIERATILFPNSTIAEISGDPQIVEQLMKVLDSVELSYSNAGFTITTPAEYFTTLTKEAKDE